MRITKSLWVVFFSLILAADAGTAGICLSPISIRDIMKNITFAGDFGPTFIVSHTRVEIDGHYLPDIITHYNGTVFSFDRYESASRIARYTAPNGAVLYASPDHNTYMRLFVGTKYNIDGIAVPAYRPFPLLESFSIEGNEIHLYGDIFLARPRYSNESQVGGGFDFDIWYLTHDLFSYDVVNTLANIFCHGIRPQDETGHGDLDHPNTRVCCFSLNRPGKEHISAVTLSLGIDPRKGCDNYWIAGPLPAGCDPAEIGLSGEKAPANEPPGIESEVRGPATQPEDIRFLIVSDHFRELIVPQLAWLMAKGYIPILPVYDPAGKLIEIPPSAGRPDPPGLISVPRDPSSKPVNTDISQ